MSSDINSISSRTIQWRSLLGLAGLQAAITLMWVVYNAYLVQLLAKFGFPNQWVTYLLMIESLVSVLFEPIMGIFSDRSAKLWMASSPVEKPTFFKQWLVGRFPWITIGAIASAIFFFVTPLIATGSNLQTIAAWILPAVIILWALFMSVFQSPAFSLIGEYASQTKLPQATSLIMVAATLVRIFGVAANQWILSKGPVAAFTVSSICLLAALFCLSLFHPQHSQPNLRNPELPRIAKRRLAATFLLGCGVGFAGRSIGAVLSAKFLVPGVSFLLVWLLGQAVALMPTGILLNRLSLNRSLLTSLGIVGIVLLTLSRHSNGTVPLGLTILLGIAYSFIVNGTLPFACEQVPSRHTGLGIGMYFSGAAMAGALFGLVVQFSGKPTPEVAALIGVVGVVGAIGGVMIEGLDGGDR